MKPAAQGSDQHWNGSTVAVYAIAIAPVVGHYELKTAIQEFIDAHQADPKPFVWTKGADEILATIARFAQRTLDARAAPQMSRTIVTGH